MMGHLVGGMWTAWLLWSGLVVLMVVAWVLLVNWAMPGNEEIVTRQLPDSAMQGAEDRRRRNATGESAPESVMQGEELRHGHA